MANAGTRGDMRDRGWRRWRRRATRVFESTMDQVEPVDGRAGVVRVKNEAGGTTPRLRRSPRSSRQRRIRSIWSTRSTDLGKVQRAGRVTPGPRRPRRLLTVPSEPPTSSTTYVLLNLISSLDGSPGTLTEPVESRHDLDGLMRIMVHPGRPACSIPSGMRGASSVWDGFGLSAEDRADQAMPSTSTSWSSAPPIDLFAPAWGVAWSSRQ